MKFCTVLISTGKCGSNTLIQSIKDTFNIDIYKPFDIELNSEIHKNFIINAYGKINDSKYMSRVYDWVSRSEKLILLLREDHLMRGISIYYANQVHINKLNKINYEVLEQFYEQPICIPELKDCVLNSYITTEILKNKISELQTPTIFPISYYDLYIRNTLRVMSELSDFLGVSYPEIKLIMNLFKYTKVEKIPNIDEILDVFKRRTLDELEYWCPNEF